MENIAPSLEPPLSAQKACSIVNPNKPSTKFAMTQYIVLLTYTIVGSQRALGLSKHQCMTID